MDRSARAGQPTARAAAEPGGAAGPGLTARSPRGIERSDILAALIPPTPSTAHSHRFRLEVQALEIARGHDGLLRGMPEPVLILAAYLLDGVSVRTLGRTLHRFAPRKPFPSRAAPDQGLSIAAEICHDLPLHVFVLAFAIEQDSSTGVQAAFGAVEHHDALALWPASHADASPMPLVEVAVHGDQWRAPTPVHVIAADRDMADLCRGDKWIAGVAWLMSPAVQASSSTLRLPFQSADRLNDWTALVSASSYQLWPDPGAAAG